MPMALLDPCDAAPLANTPTDLSAIGETTVPHGTDASTFWLAAAECLMLSKGDGRAWAFPRDRLGLAALPGGARTILESGVFDAERSLSADDCAAHAEAQSTDLIVLASRRKFKAASGLSLGAADLASMMHRLACWRDGHLHIRVSADDGALDGHYDAYVDHVTARSIRDLAKNGVDGCPAPTRAHVANACLGPLAYEVSALRDIRPHAALWGSPVINWSPTPEAAGLDCSFEGVLPHRHGREDAPVSGELYEVTEDTVATLPDGMHPYRLGCRYDSADANDDDDMRTVVSTILLATDIKDAARKAELLCAHFHVYASTDIRGHFPLCERAMEVLDGLADTSVNRNAPEPNEPSPT